MLWLTSPRVLPMGIKCINAMTQFLPQKFLRRMKREIREIYSVILIRGNQYIVFETMEQ